MPPGTPDLPDIHEDLLPFEHDANVEDIADVSADEAKTILGRARDAALYDMQLDAGRDGVAHPEESVQLVHSAFDAAIRSVEDVSEINEDAINRFWDDIYPLLRGSIELPSDRVQYEAVVRVPQLPFHHGPSGRTKDPVAKVIRNRILQVTGAEWNAEEGTWYARVINPLDILREPWVDIGPNGEAIERIPDLQEILSWSPAAQGVFLGSAHHFRIEAHDPAVVQRTIPHRLADHERLLLALRTAQPRTSEAALAQALFGARPELPPVFIDIGSGIGNADLHKVHDGMGSPAITSAEIADAFPDMPVVVLDLPQAVDRFTMDPALVRGRVELLRRPNISVVRGNGLHPLREQLLATDSNPLPDRPRPIVESGAPIILRSANAIDVYCSWDAPNGEDPSVRDALQRIAEDFIDNPIMLLYNRAILLKDRMSTAWRLVGRVSAFGFNSADRRLGHSGRPAYELDDGLAA